MSDKHPAGEVLPEPQAATLRWHYEDGQWWAESPEYPEWTSFGEASLDAARLLAHGGLRFLGATKIVDSFTMPLIGMSNA